MPAKPKLFQNYMKEPFNSEQAPIQDNLERVPTQADHPPSYGTRLLWPILILCAALLVADLVVSVLYQKSRRQLKTANDQLATLQKPGSNTGNETTDLISKVGQLVVLPTDEQPTIATVNY